MRKLVYLLIAMTINSVFISCEDNNEVVLKDNFFVSLDYDTDPVKVTTGKVIGFKLSEVGEPNNPYTLKFISDKRFTVLYDGNEYQDTESINVTNFDTDIKIKPLQLGEYNIRTHFDNNSTTNPVQRRFYIEFDAFADTPIFLERISSQCSNLTYRINTNDYDDLIEENFNYSIKIEAVSGDIGNLQLINSKNYTFTAARRTTGYNFGDISRIVSKRDLDRSLLKFKFDSNPTNSVKIRITIIQDSNTVYSKDILFDIESSC